MTEYIVVILFTGIVGVFYDISLDDVASTAYVHNQVARQIFKK